MNRHGFSRRVRAAENTVLIRLDALDTLKAIFGRLNPLYVPSGAVSRAKAAAGTTGHQL
jgi:hypothetical protein